MLRPAVDELVRGGSTVIAVARSAADLQILAAEHPGTVTGIAVDYRDADRFLRLLQSVHTPASAAIVYIPSAEPAALSTLRSLVRGPVVQVLTSHVADPAGGEPFTFENLPQPPGQPWYRLVLGWSKTGAWHSPDEISAAAVAVLRQKRDGQLGELRPWTDRPEA
ncbi:hypothetical protein AL755_03815 (plasmid) [Arthrobacter sp. ERGS1:01]|nr:hypothetical protein AL755_03815 [Arthrobacter sp. ERGS1:01]